MDHHRMSRYLASFVAVVALAAMPASASAASTCTPGTLYCIPPAVTPAEAAHTTAGTAAGILSKLRPAALAGKGRVALSGTTSGPGTLKIVLTAKLHGKTVVLGTGVSTTGAAGTTTVEVALTKAGKRALKGQKGKLTITVTAAFTPKGGTAASSSSKVGLK
jgi:hypothetical protein